MLYMSKDIAKLATFESQKEVVCTTHLWNLKKGARPRNQCDRNHRAAESAQQREARLGDTSKLLLKNEHHYDAKGGRGVRAMTLILA